jgi:hypothetical protein
MSKASRGDPFLAAMTEGQEVDAVFRDHVDEEISEDLPEGLETLRNAYQEFWAETHHTDPVSPADDTQPEDSTEIIDHPSRLKSDPLGQQKDHAAESMLDDDWVERGGGADAVRESGVKPGSPARQPRWGGVSPRTKAASSRRTPKSRRAVLKPRLRTKAKVRSSVRRVKQPAAHNSTRPSRQRFGLPKGFVPRMQRFGRGVLLELNIYSLTNGQEFIPCLPTGPLGSRHLYALLTAEQYLRGRRGSVYVRGDGRIFDYSVVSANSLGDMFDTGYTIYDLERTGRYAPGTESQKRTALAADKLKRLRKQKAQPKKSRRAAGAR